MNFLGKSFFIIFSFAALALLTPYLAKAEQSFTYPQNQQPDIDLAKQTPLLGLDEKLDTLLMAELISLGYDAKLMRESSDKISALSDSAEQKVAADRFNRHYQSLALRGLRQLSKRAGNPFRLEEFLQNTELALEKYPTTTIGKLPDSILMIYQQIEMSAGIASINANLSPCLTWRIRVGCLLSILSGKECAYAPNILIPADQQLPPIHLQQNLPSGNEELTAEWQTNEGMSILVHQYGIRNFEHNNTRPSRAGFKWPLKQTDQSMCIEMNSHGVYSRVLAEAYFGYASATAQWWLSLNGIGTPLRATTPGNSCAYSQTISSRSGEETTTFRNTTSQACWFRGLNSLYQSTFRARPFTPIANDSETHNAASVEISSNISTAITRDGIASGALSEMHLRLSGIGILIVRDR